MPLAPGPIPCDAGNKGDDKLRELTGLPPGESLRLYERAFRNGWQMSDAERREVIDACLGCLRDTGTSYTRRVAAARVLVQADMVNVSRERIASQEKAQGDRTSLEALRLALSSLSPEQLDALTRATLPPQCLQDGTETPPA